MLPKFANKLIVSLALLMAFMGYAQEFTSFTRTAPTYNGFRYQNNLKGDLTFIGNNILNREEQPTIGPNTPYNNQNVRINEWWLRPPGHFDTETGGFWNYNDYKSMAYIDVDSDITTFSSSSSTLTLDDPSCSRIRYAGLYWAATYPSATANGVPATGFSSGSANTTPVGQGRQTDNNQVRFMVPGAPYTDITGELLYDGFFSTDPAMRRNSPYAYYADVTDLITVLTDPQGEYTVANIRATEGVLLGQGGSAGGWTLVIAYENPSMPGRLITTFDGFAWVKDNDIVPIQYTGFNTIPAGPVRADIGAATLEGDFAIPGDFMRIRASQNATFSTVREINGNLDENNIFNSDITLDGAITTNRNPNSTNTLGYDTDMFRMRNTSNNVIDNDETAATFEFRTNGDQYYPFFNSFNIEILEPNVVLEKKVFLPGGSTDAEDITGEGVNLGQVIDYVLSFQNIGNDNATGIDSSNPDYTSEDSQFLTIKDILPINISPPDGRANFIPSDFVLPPGMAQPTYDPVTRVLLFEVPNELVEVGRPIYQIRMTVQIAENCFDFVNACSDEIQNLAYTTYAGVINDNKISDDPSVTDFDTCGFVTPGATNFLLDDLSACDFYRTIELCGASVTLDAGDGFDGYDWYLDVNEDNLIDAGDTLLNSGGPNNDTLVVTQFGTYIVDKADTDPCKGFQEIIQVVPYGSGLLPNPVIEYFNTVNNDTDPFNDLAGEIVQCSIDNALLPKLFLCGLNDIRVIQTNILDADSIIWEQLDESSCTSSGDDCANRNLGCTWNQVGVGDDYQVENPGKYRLQVIYDNGCTTRFYFNVFQNTFDIATTKQDIICNTPGNITVTNPISGYAYRLVDDFTGTIVSPFSTTSSFDFGTGENGGYRVEATQLDASNQPIVGACIFTTSVIGILERNVTFGVNVSPKTCFEQGSVNIEINSANPNYDYEIRVDDGTPAPAPPANDPYFGQHPGGTFLDDALAQTDNDFTFSGLADGDYFVIARTDDDCIHVEQITIIDEDTLELVASVDQHISCNPGQVEMTASGGTTPYAYAIWTYVNEGGTTVTSYPDVGSIPDDEFTTNTLVEVLLPGQYTFVVVDQANCPSFSNIATVVVEPEIIYTITNLDESCFGAEDGSSVVNVTNAQGNSLSYSLQYPDLTILDNTSGTFLNLAQGDYELVITATSGSNSCEYLETFTIGGPADGISGTAAIIVDYICGQNGSIQAQNVTGGTAPYSYSIDGVTFIPDTTPDANTFTNLTEGTYIITIRDANDCTITTNSVTLEPLNPPTDLTFVSTAPNCPDLTSNVTLTVTGGSAPFAYEITAPTGSIVDNGASNVFNALAPGTYTFLVTDDKNCSYSEDYTITPVNSISVTEQLDNNISCFGLTDGAATFNVGNFNTTYDYAVTGPGTFSGTAQTASTIPLTALAAGTYTITVTDNETNCTATAGVTINGPPAALVISNLAVTDLSCSTTGTVPGSVTITAVDGWGGFEYELEDPAGTTVGPQTTNSFTGLTDTSGAYTVTVRDAGGCEETATFTLTTTVAPVLDLTANSLCYDSAVGLTLTASVTSGGEAPFQYRLSGGGAYQSNPVFTGLAPGNYTVEVIDNKNCTGSASIEVFPTLNATASLIKDLDCSATPDAEISVTIAGGNPTFTYEVFRDGTSVQASAAVPSIPFSYFTTTAGTYEFVITDNETCTDTTNEIIVSPNTPPVAVEALTAPLCATSADGSVELQISGGLAPYQIVFDGSAPSTQTTYGGLSAGTVYNYTVTDAKGCILSDSVTLTAPDPIIPGTIDLITDYRCDNTSATIQAINYSGGTPGYTFSIDGVNFQVSDTFSTGITAGSYIISIRDANGCIAQTPALVIDPLNQPTDISFVQTAPTCPAVTADVTLTVTDGTAPFAYEITAPSGSIIDNGTSNVFTSLAPGTYTFQATDSRGCVIQRDYTVTDVNRISVLAQLTNNISCFGSADGAFIFTVSDFTGTYSYDVTNSAATSVLAQNNINLTTPVPVTALAADTYTVTITDDTTNCTATTTMVISAPPAALVISNLAVTDLSCSTTGTVPGSVTITAVDGWGGFEYELEDPAGTTVGPQTTNSFTGFTDTSGAYTVTVRDAGGCEETATFTLTTTVAPVLDLTANSLCYDSAVGLTLTASVTSGGEAPFQYRLSGGGAYQSNPVFTGLAPGNYTVEVIDNKNCTGSASIEVFPTLNATASLIKDLDCSATPDAEISVTIAGGNPTFTYEVFRDGTSVQASAAVPSIPFSYFTTTAGTYEFVITDNETCTDTTNEIIVSPNTPPVAVEALTAPLCATSADGSVELQISGGLAPYQIVFDGSAPSTQTTYGGLSAGTVYNYTVTDAKGCILSDSVTLTAPDPIIPGTIDLITDYRCDNTSATIQAINYSGGTPGYTFSIDGVNFQVSDTFSTGITAGSYIISIRDANGCIAQTPALVIDPLNQPTDISFVQTAPTCPAVTADVTLTVTDGTAPFAYEITAPSGSIIDNGTSNVFTSLAPGTYTFQATDSRGCVIQRDYTVTDVNRISVLAQLTNNISCFGSADGAFIFTVSDFTGTYSYDVTNSAATSVLAQNNINLTTPVPVTALAADTYTVTITDDTTNCTATTTMVIAAPPAALDFTAANTDVTCLANSTITVTPIGGWGGYEYQLENTVGPAIIYAYQSSASFADVAAGTYNVYIRDAGNCIVSKPITIDPAETPSISVNPTSDYCYDGTNQASLVITITDGVAPFTYSIDGGGQIAALGNPFTISNLIPDSYNIQVMDAYGCISNVLTETIATQLSASTLISKALDCTASPNATIDVTIANGYTPYSTYEVSTDAGGTWTAPTTIVGNTFSHSAPVAGTYDFRVTDNLGCTVITQAIIDPIINPDITSLVQTVDILCNGDNGATIVVNLDNTQGAAPFVISVVNTTTATPYGTQTSGLPAGTYEVTVTDSKMCTDTETIVISEPDAITYDVNLIPITCGMTGTNPGSISVENVAGGTPGFTYHLRGNNGYSATQIEPLGANYTFTILEFGIYEVDVVDANGCSVLTTNIIASPPDDLDIDVSAVTANCATGGTAEVTVSTAILGTNYEFGILDTYAVPYASTYFSPDVVGGPTHTFTGLTPGITYTFVVHDLTTNCYYFETADAPISSPSNLTSNLDAVNNVTCTGSNDGNVTFSFDNYAPDATMVRYEIFNSQSNITTGITADILVNPPAVGTGVTVTNVGPLPFGLYYILFSELDGTYLGCSVASVEFNITESSNELAVTATLDKNDNCNVNAGQVSAVAQFGTTSYEYQIALSTDTAPTALTWAGSTANIFNVEGGDYIVYAMDAHGCIRFDAVTVPTDLDPEITLVLNDQCTADEGGFSVEITLDVPGIAPHSISIDGAAPIAAPGLNLAGDTMTISNLSSGPHSITLVDQNGCTDIDPITIYSPINVSANVTAEESCVPANVGEVTVTANGGSGNYSYTQTIPAGPTNATGIFAGLTHSVAYTFEVEDTTTNCTEPVTITLTAPSIPTFTLAKSDVSCFGGNDGSITVNLNGGNTDTPYLYSLDGGTTTQPSNVFLARSQGLHNVTVISDKGCSDAQSITIDEPTALDATVTNVVEFSCDATSGAVSTASFTVTADPTTGTGPYFFSIDGGTFIAGTGVDGNIHTHTTAVDATFTIDVEDTNGCAMTQFTHTIDPLNAMTLSISNIVAIDCVNNLETMTVDVAGSSGTAPANLSYQLLPSGTPQANGNFSFTTPGDYTIRVTDTDTDCFEEITHTVNQYLLLEVTTSLVTDATCSDSTDGQLQIEVSGYTGAFSYQVLDNTGADVVGASGNDNAVTDPYNFVIPQTLPAGIYSVRVTETAFPQCSFVSNTQTIDAPEVIVVSEVSNTPANCNDDAIVVVQAVGGTPGYTYAVVVDGSPAPTTAIEFTEDETLNLNPATSLVWDVYARDTNGCISPVALDITITLDTSPDITLAIDDECAEEGSFGITVTLDAVNFGVAPYTMSLDSGAFQSIASFPHTFDGLSAGAHSVVIRDANACEDTENVTIIEELIMNAIVVTQPTCATADGVIEFTVTGGDISNVVTLLNATTLVDTGLTPTGNQFTGVAFGDYIVRVTDAPLTPASCFADAAVSLEEPTPVTLLAPEKTDISCFGADDGTITVNMVPTSVGVNDNPPYIYEITDGTTTFTQGTNLFTGLTPGVWNITVTSNRDCSDTQSITIDEPTALSATVTNVVEFSCDATSGAVSTASFTVTADPTTGTGPYFFSIDGGTFIAGTGVDGNIHTHTTAVDATFTIDVEDTNGCAMTQFTHTIDPLNAMTLSISNIVAIDCVNNLETMTVDVAGSSGTAPANLSYQLLPSGTPQANGNFSFTTPGDYTIRVTDTDTDCFEEITHTVNQYLLLEVTTSLVTDATCSDSTDGQLQIEVSGYTGAFSYQVLDNTGADVVGASGNDNAVTDPYNFVIPQTLPAGIYSVRVTETAFPQCSFVSNTQTIDAPEVIVVSEVSNTPANCNDDAIVVVQAVGGTPGYTYAVVVDGSPAPTTAIEFTEDETLNLNPATSLVWDVYARDTNGCISPVALDITITLDTSPDITLAIDDECAEEGSFGITVTLDAVNFGVAPYTMSLDSGAFQSIASFPHTFDGLSAGAHSVVIRDANACEDTENVTIIEELIMNAIVVTQPTCATADGVIEFTVTGGDISNVVTLLNATTLVDTGLTPTGNQFTGVAFGDYIVRVTDAPLTPASCFADAAVSLEEPTPVTLLAPEKTDISCFGADDGTITVNMVPTSVGVNDNPPYIYEITDGTTTFTQGTNLFTGLTPGVWNITVTSNRDCSDTQSITIDEPTALDATVTNVVEFSCDVNNTAQTASIEVTITAGTGTPDYFYSLDGTTFFPTSGNVFTHAVNAAGNFDFIIRDANGCLFNVPTVTIAPLNTFTATVALSDAITCANNREEIVITVVDDGNPHTYTYELLPIVNPNGTQTATTGNTATFDLTAVGSYVFRITDTTTGCYVDTASYEIAPYDLIEVTATAVDPVICVGDNSGSLEINVTGYTTGTTYDYQVFDSAGNPVGALVSTDTSVNPRIINGLSGGNYSVTVYETDATSTFCSDDSNTITILSPDTPLSVLVDALANVTCDNDKGEILVDPSGGYPPYDIILTNTTTGEIYPTVNDVLSHIFTGLSAGNFTVSVTDSARVPGCEVNDVALLIEPSLITASATPANTLLTCFGDNNATISAVGVMNGSGSYQYQLNYYEPLDVNDPYNTTGATIVNSSGPQSSDTFNNLGAGIYSITVSDGWNCDTETNLVTIEEPEQIRASLIRTSGLTCETGVEFMLTATGGRSGSYDYSLDGTVWSAMTLNPMPLPESPTVYTIADTYQFFVRDAVNTTCEPALSNSITEEPIVELELIIEPATSEFVSCFGDDTAVIYADAIGGLGNYQFELYDNYTGSLTDLDNLDPTLLNLSDRIVGPSTNDTFGGLIAGTYYVNVISEDCVAKPKQVIITQPDELFFDVEVVDVLCPGETNGSITITPRGGAGGYIYAISPNLAQFFSDPVFDELTPGDYTIIAQDQNGCLEVIERTIIQPEPLVVSATTTPEICAGDENGIVILDITGGNGPYSTRLESETDFVLDRLTFADMASGGHIIYIEDVNGCPTDIGVTIEPGVNLNATIEPIYECTGDTPDNYINITFEDPSVMGDVLYALDSTDPNDLQLNFDFRNIAPGMHFITVAHSGGCPREIEFEIEDFEPLTLSLASLEVNLITATAAGGKENYTYYFDDVDNGNENTYRINRTDTYVVRVVDENGCEVTSSIEMEFIDIEIPNFFTPDGDGENDFWKPRNQEAFPQILTLIFDRYGREVYRLGLNDQGWDGLYNESELPTGDYWYVIKLKGEIDDREFVGHFTLYR